MGNILGLGTVWYIQLGVLRQGQGEKDRPTHRRREKEYNELGVAGGRLNYGSGI